MEMDGYVTDPSSFLIDRSLEQYYIDAYAALYISVCAHVVGNIDTKRLAEIRDEINTDLGERVDRYFENRARYGGRACEGDL